MGGDKHEFLKNGSKIFWLSAEFRNLFETSRENPALAQAILRASRLLGAKRTRWGLITGSRVDPLQVWREIEA